MPKAVGDFYNKQEQSSHLHFQQRQEVLYGQYANHHSCPKSSFHQRNFQDIINQLDRNLLVPEFIEVKKIDKNDFIGFPIPKYEKDIEQYTEDDCRFYGIMLGDGNISSVNNLAYVALNKDTKKDTMDFVENYLTKMNIHITYTYAHDKYVRLTWTRTNMFKFTYEMLYDANKESVNALGRQGLNRGRSLMKRN